jgi:hypothetical protein
MLGDVRRGLSRIASLKQQKESGADAALQVVMIFESLVPLQGNFSSPRLSKGKHRR